MWPTFPKDRLIREESAMLSDRDNLHHNKVVCASSYWNMVRNIMADANTPYSYDLHV